MRLVLMSIAVMFLTSGCVTTQRYDEAQARAEALEAERDRSLARIAELEQEYAALGARTAVLEEMVGTLRNLDACIRRLQIEAERPGGAR